MAEKTPLYEAAARSGGQFVEQGAWLVPAHFGDPAEEYGQAREKAVFFDLSARGKIELTGPEASFFLNNLCTNDVKNLFPGADCEAFLCTAKARVVAQVLIGHFRQEERAYFLLDFVPGMADKVLAHLDHHLISEQVELADWTREIALVHLCGPEAAAILEKVLGKKLALAPLHHQEVVMEGAGPCQVRRHDPLGLAGFDLFCRPQGAAMIWQLLENAGARPAGNEVREILRIEAGTPEFGPDMDENRLVMEVGRTLQAISFTKGCFLGQEPIVMARDRGHANRTLLGLKIAEGGPAKGGAMLFHENQEVGQVASSVVSPRLGPIALAYLRRGHQEPGTAVQIDPAVDGRQAMVVSLQRPVIWKSTP